MELLANSFNWLTASDELASLIGICGSIEDIRQNDRVPTSTILFGIHQNERGSCTPKVFLLNSHFLSFIPPVPILLQNNNQIPGLVNVFRKNIFLKSKLN